MSIFVITAVNHEQWEGDLSLERAKKIGKILALHYRKRVMITIENRSAKPGEVNLWILEWRSGYPWQWIAERIKE